MNKIMLIGLYLSLLIFGCKRKETIDPYAGDIDNLTMNGKPWKRFEGWKASVYAGSPINYPCYPVGNPDSLFDFFIYYNNQFKEERENITISDIKPQLGIQNLFKRKQRIDSCPPVDVPSAAYFLSAEDGDVAVGYYLPSENINHFINITHFDKISGEMRGTFDITFVVSNRMPSYKELYPDTIRFQNGQFRTIFQRTK